MSGFLVAAPASGSGKTTITLGLLRALKERSVAVRSGKAGPDFIDPKFHEIASGASCYNFDPWGMRGACLRAQAADCQKNDELLVVEAMMGLFDGAADGKGSAADLAAALDLPIILVVDCSKLSHSIAAIVHGFSTFRTDIHVVGVILNKVASDRHEMMLRDALKDHDVQIIGCLTRDHALVLPERHLGLVQAAEIDGLETMIARVAEKIRASFDLDGLLKIAASHPSITPTPAPSILSPLGQHIAIARDLAFSFVYPHLLDGWRKQGAHISFFSPLADEGPDSACDAVFLPGGYPELHAAHLAQNSVFQVAMHAAINAGKIIYGECGGYMVLGKGLIDAEGKSHTMLGALPLVTSFADPKRTLGYRVLKPINGFLGSDLLKAHEFHYSTIIDAGINASAEVGAADPLFTAKDASGQDLGPVGMRVGNVAGSYMHVIDRAP